MKYEDLLKDPKWKERRLKILDRDNWECSCCHSREKSLNVHHRRYIPGRNPWEYPDEDLVTLCEHCHGQHHEVLDAFRGLSLRGKFQFFYDAIAASEERPKTQEYKEFLFVEHKEHPNVCYVIYVPTGRFSFLHMSVDDSYDMILSRPELEQELKGLVVGASPYEVKEERG